MSKLSKTAELQKRVRRIWPSESVDIQFRFGGANQGWYLTKKGYQAYIGANIDEANKYLIDIVKLSYGYEVKNFHPYFNFDPDSIVWMAKSVCEYKKIIHNVYGDHLSLTEIRRPGQPIKYFVAVNGNCRDHQYAIAIDDILSHKYAIGVVKYHSDDTNHPPGWYSSNGVMVTVEYRLKELMSSFTELGWYLDDGYRSIYLGNNFLEAYRFLGSGDLSLETDWKKSPEDRLNSVASIRNNEVPITEWDDYSNNQLNSSGNIYPERIIAIGFSEIMRFNMLDKSSVVSLLGESARIRETLAKECKGNKDEMIGSLAMLLTLERKERRKDKLLDRKLKLESLITNTDKFLAAHLKLRFGGDITTIEQLAPEKYEEALQMIEALIRSVKKESRHEPAQAPQRMEVGPEKSE